MDPLTQGVLGGVAAQMVCGRRLPHSAWLIGVAAGMAADLDIFIRPASDPLGGLTYHRHFTHALAFIPVGALVSACVFLPWRRFGGVRAWVLLAALLGYSTHGLLDACTSYGTVLWWPFSDARVAWDLIGIIDPVFTVALVAGLAASCLTRRRRIAGVALSLALAYLGVGAVQHARVVDVQRALAADRGHTIARHRAMPTPLNLILWRAIYLSDGRIHADSVRVPFFGPATVRTGSAAPLVTLEEVAARRPVTPAVRAAFRRFAWFADGYTTWDALAPDTIADMRYALEPDVHASLWGLRLPADSDERPVFQHFGRARRDALGRFWDALGGRDPTFVPLASIRH